MQGELIDRRTCIQQMRNNTPPYQAIAENPPPEWASAYSNRSIIKEIDQLVSQVTPEKLDGSTVSIELRGRRPHLPFIFDRQVARKFHTISAQRELGPAMIVTAIIRSLDRGNRFAKPSGKIRNVDTGREVSLHLSDTNDFESLHPYHNGEAVRIFVCPIVEALGFDMKGGDLMFLAVV